MFGSKFRTWMEAHIVRARKKGQRKDGSGGGGGTGAEHPSPMAPAPPPPRHTTANCKHSCSGSSGGSGGGGSSLEAMLGGSQASGSGVGGGGASLSSPESAYSTGYSTDGTSPGASFPPEYYINIRTGTHYFQQGTARQVTAPPVPPPARPVPPPRPPPKQVDFILDHTSPAVPKKELPKTQISSQLNVQQPVKATQSDQKCECQLRCLPPGHRRSESCDVGRSPLVKIPVPVEEPTSLIPVPNIALSASPSPRQRSRIRTNPWVPNSVVGTASSSSSFGRPNGVDENCNASTCSSSGNGFKSGSGSDSTAKKQPLPHPREPKKSILVACKENSPVVRSPVPSVTWSPRRLAVTVSSSSSGSRRSSDDDLTLHEMMGKYDESYVYERETDILSDSDPTDCEDCADTDADTGLDGGDEQDPEDLDFIDKDSFQDLNLADTDRGPRRLGHSSYYHLPNELSRKLSRHRESSARRAGSAARRGAKTRSGPRRRRPREATASRSLGGTPVSNRRKPLDNISELRNQSPVRLAMQRTLLIEDSRGDSVKRRSNSVSYVSRSCEVRQSIPGGNYLANFDSEIALIEADKEADKKYKELIMEAEHILVSMKATTPILGSPRRALNNPPANKRVELLRNAEHDLPKVRGVDSIPGSPKFCGSPRFSPKKNHITNFMQINSPELSRREPTPVLNDVFSSPKKLLIHSPPVIQRNLMPKPEVSRSLICPNSPRMARKNLSASSPMKCIENGNSSKTMNGHSTKKSPPICRPMTPQPSSPLLHIDDDSDDSTEKEQSNVISKQRNDSIAFQESIKNLTFLDKSIQLHVDSQSGDSSSLVGGTSSSSDGDGEHNKKIKDKRPPLLTFRSVDIGHRVPDSGYCPQSEPVKRKVYSCSATFDRLQKSLEPHHLIRQKSDGEASTTDERATDDSQVNLRDKMVRSRTEKLETDDSQNTDSSDPNGQVQRQMTLLRRQMLLQTIEGLKRSLEDQSASLKKTYHESDAKHENIETY